jgi:hypothetical protein
LVEVRKVWGSPRAWFEKRGCGDVVSKCVPWVYCSLPNISKSRNCWGQKFLFGTRIFGH